MGADSNDDEKIGINTSISVGCWVAEFGHIDFSLECDFCCSSSSNEERFALKAKHHVFTLGNITYSNFNLTHGQSFGWHQGANNTRHKFHGTISTNTSNGGCHTVSKCFPCYIISFLSRILCTTSTVVIKAGDFHIVVKFMFEARQISRSWSIWSWNI